MICKNSVSHPYISDNLPSLQPTSRSGRTQFNVEEAIDIKQGIIDKNKEDKH